MIIDVSIFYSPIVLIVIMAPLNDDDHTLWVVNLDCRVTEEILWELFLQAGPLKSAKIPKYHKTGVSKYVGFVVFQHQVSVRYAIELLEGIRLYGSPLQLCQKNKPTGYIVHNLKARVAMPKEKRVMEQFSTDMPARVPYPGMTQTMSTSHAIRFHPVMMPHRPKDPHLLAPHDWKDGQIPYSQRWRQCEMRRRYSFPGRLNKESRKHEPYIRGSHHHK